MKRNLILIIFFLLPIILPVSAKPYAEGILNSSFENWSGTSPHFNADYWILVPGSGTHILNDYNTTSWAHEGDYSADLWARTSSGILSEKQYYQQVVIDIVVGNLYTMSYYLRDYTDRITVRLEGYWRQGTNNLGSLVTTVWSSDNTNFQQYSVSSVQAPVGADNFLFRFAFLNETNDISDGYSVYLDTVSMTGDFAPEFQVTTTSVYLIALFGILITIFVFKRRRSNRF